MARTSGIRLIDPEQASVEIPLVERISAYEFAELIAGIHNAYASALWLELAADNIREGVFPQNYKPHDSETLWIEHVEVGTPNRIRLRGLARPILATVALLTAVLEGPQAIGNLAKTLAETSKIKVETQLLQLEAEEKQLNILDRATELYLKGRISEDSFREKTMVYTYAIRRLQNGASLVAPQAPVVVSRQSHNAP